tara:strand:- start:255 stop:587 length:333 start_codon:yes stop_codon:yes gene_type:complete
LSQAEFHYITVRFLPRVFPLRFEVFAIVAGNYNDSFDAKTVVFEQLRAKGNQFAHARFTTLRFGAEHRVPISFQKTIENPNARRLLIGEKVAVSGNRLKYAVLHVTIGYH